MVLRDLRAVGDAGLLFRPMDVKNTDSASAYPRQKLEMTGIGAEKRHPTLGYRARLQTSVAATAATSMVFGLAATGAGQAQQVIADGIPVVILGGVIDTGTTAGEAGHGLYALNGGTIVVTAPVQVMVYGQNANGVQAVSGSTVTFAPGSTVASRFGQGLYAGGGRIEAENITITAGAVGATSAQGYGVRAEGGGEVILDGGSITALRTGLVATGAGASITSNDVAIQTTSSSGGGANSSNRARVDIIGGSILVAGTSGLYSYNQSILTASNVAVTVTGTNAIGATSNLNSVMTLTDVDIHTTGLGSTGARANNSRLIFTGGSILTEGQSSYGLHSLSQAGFIDASNLSIETRGDNSAGAVVELGADINLTSSTISTTGDNAAGLLGLQTSLADNPILTATDVAVTTTGVGSHGVSLLGAPTIRLTDGSVHAQGEGASAIYAAANGAAFGRVFVDGTTLTSDQAPAILAVGTRLDGDFTGATITGDGLWLSVQPDNGGIPATVNLDLSDSFLTGAALTAAGSTSTVLLDQDTEWLMTGDSNLTSLTLDAGTLRYGVGSATLNTVNPIMLAAGGGTIDTNGFNPELAASFDGAGGLTKQGAGMLTLTGVSSGYSGAATVAAGTLRVDGALGDALSTLDVASGGTLGGGGTVGGSVTVADGGILAPNAGGSGSASTLTINGDLELNGGSILNYNFGQADVVGGAYNDLTIVHGDLTLDGTLNVALTPGGSFDPGIYRVISYDGTLTDNILDLGPLPTTDTYSVQTSVEGQVDLVLNAPLNTFTFWDGADAGLHGNGAVNGGDGIWQSSAGNTNWTDQTGGPIGAWDDGSFAIFMAKPGTVTVDDGQGPVAASGMQFASDGYVIQGDDLALLPDAQGQSLIRVGDGSSVGAGFTATISADLTGATQLVKHDLGTLVLSGTNSYTGGTVIGDGSTGMGGGTLQVSEDGNLGDLSGGVRFDDGTLHTTASFATARDILLAAADGRAGYGGTFEIDPDTTLTLTGAITGSGSLTKTQTGTLLLMGTSNSYSGDTIISSGTLQAGAGNTFSPNSAMTVAGAGTLDLAGFSQTVAGLSNTGLVNFGTGTPPGALLTVNGDYVGDGGTIVLNTVLGADNSPTDRLVVNGDTSGSTSLRVVNAGGLGAQTTGNGIEVVQVDGASDGSFSLTGRLAAGAFDYNLFKNGVGADAADGDWYLRSGFRPEVAVDTVVPALASRLGLAMLGTYTRRTGKSGVAQLCADDASAQSSSRGSGCNTLLWGRLFGVIGSFGEDGSNGRFGSGGPAYDFSYGGLQAGADLYRTAQDIAGLYLGAATLGSDVDNANGSAAGQVDMDAYSLGAYWTHRNPAGWYTDLVLQGIWYDNIRASSVTGQSFDTRGWGLAASAEAGYRIVLGDYSMIPQAQLIYQRTDIDGGSDVFGRIDYGATDEIYGRLGVNLTRNWTTDNGRKVTGWVEANLWHQFGDDARTTFSTLDGANPTAVEASLGGTWTQLGLGLSGQITDKVSVFGAADYNISLDDSADSISAHTGIRVSW